jgi:hypothetical protein
MWWPNWTLFLEAFADCFQKLLKRFNSYFSWLPLLSMERINFFFSRLTAVGILCADHATPSILKSCH